MNKREAKDQLNKWIMERKVIIDGKAIGSGCLERLIDSIEPEADGAYHQFEQGKHTLHDHALIQMEDRLIPFGLLRDLYKKHQQKQVNMENEVPCHVCQNICDRWAYRIGGWAICKPCWDKYPMWKDQKPSREPEAKEQEVKCCQWVYEQWSELAPLYNKKLSLIKRLGRKCGTLCKKVK